MAGGRATRFNTPVEKGVLEVGGRTLLERAAIALRGGGIGDVHVAVTEATPATTLRARQLGVRPVFTGGRGYHEDVLELLEENDEFITLNVDLPFVRAEHVTTLLRNIGRGSVTTVVPAASAIQRPRKDSLMLGPDGAEMVWVGLNIVTPNPDISLLVLDDPLLAVNVNNEDDLAFANRLAEEQEHRQRHWRD